jgi:hypothetical protein
VICFRVLRFVSGHLLPSMNNDIAVFEPSSISRARRLAWTAYILPDQMCDFAFGL